MGMQHHKPPKTPNRMGSREVGNVQEERTFESKGLCGRHYICTNTSALEHTKNDEQYNPTHTGVGCIGIISFFFSSFFPSSERTKPQDM